MRPYVSLRSGSRFRSVYRSGRRRRVGGITVLRAAGHESLPEVGIVAGKKVGNAVSRNRAKRRLREAAQRVDLQPHKAYVLVASPEVLDAPFDTVVEWLRRAVTELDQEQTKDRR